MCVCVCVCVCVFGIDGRVAVGTVGGGGVREGGPRHLTDLFAVCHDVDHPVYSNTEWPVRVGCISTVRIGPLPNTFVR